MARGTSGTLVYMSPQQLNGEHASHLDDIYSLGATLYELLTSKPPFYSGDIGRQIENKIPPPLSQRRDELGTSGSAIPAPWEAAIAACLAKDPGQRPASGAALLAALEAPTPGGNLRASEPTLFQHTRRIRPPSGRIPKVAGGLAAGLFLCAAVLALWWFGIQEPKQRAAENPVAAAGSPASNGPQTANRDKPFENSLGMKFVPVPGTNALFSVWETRVRDFRAYARATGYEQKGGIFTIKVEKQKKNTVAAGGEHDEKGSWERPGFTQGDDHPVVAVSWDEARQFCDWLTKKERQEGLITPQQEYRLPKDEEWSTAVGSTRYPWGDGWPPRNDEANLLDEATIRALGNKGHAEVKGDDGYRETAPVGHYRPNPFGIYDMGGNVFEWCEDRFRAGDESARSGEEERAG